MKTAVIYARYSSNNQTEQSIEGQIHVCEDYAKRHDIIIVDSYIDRAISGTTDERDAFQRMLKDSNSKKWDYILVYKLDRFARNKYEAAIHRKHLKDNGIRILSAMENIPETPEGVLLESLLEGMNQYFSEELAQKVNRGLHESRMKGHCIGAVPYGYIKEHKTLSINELEARIIQRIYTDYANGKTILQISKDLESENITNNGKPFLPQNLRHILQREVYTGILKIHGKVYDKIYPQIISIPLFTEVQARMDKTRYGCRKDNHEVFRLKDKIYCGVCGKKMYPISAISSNGNHLRYYTCISTKKDNCDNKRIYKDFVEGCIDRLLKQQFCSDGILTSLVDELYTSYKKSIGNNNAIANLKNDLQRVNKTIANIMVAIEKGVVTNTTKSRLEELETQQIAMHEKIIVEEAKVRYELTKEDILDFFRYAIKEGNDFCYNVFIKFVRVYPNKIEIGLNYGINQESVDRKPIIRKISTELYQTERLYKGGTVKTQTFEYDVYVVI